MSTDKTLVTEDELIRISEWLEWRNAEARIYWLEQRVKRMLKAGTFRGYSQLEHIVEYDGAKSWRTRTNADLSQGHDPG